MVKDILVINPGSTTTKIGMYREGNFVFQETITHNPDVILELGSIPNQLDYRVKVINQVLINKEYDIKNIDAIVGRGGMIVGLLGGGYEVNEKLYEALKSPDNPQHASSLGGMIAFEIGRELGVPAYIYDSPMGCELMDIAKVTGLKGYERYGAYHVLNAKAQGRNYADSVGAKYEDLNLIVAHMGGGITVTAHKNGKIIDGLSYDDGPMSPERTGGMPLLLWNQVCFNLAHNKENAEKLICGKGGLYSYLGVTDCRQVEKLISEGNEEAKLVYEAMAYQVAKSIAQLTVPLEGKIDGIILTGGAANSKKLTANVTKYAQHVGKIIVLPGEDELLALAKGTYRIITGEEKAHIF